MKKIIALAAIAGALFVLGEGWLIQNALKPEPVPEVTVVADTGELFSRLGDVLQKVDGCPATAIAKDTETYIFSSADDVDPWVAFVCIPKASGPAQ